MATGYTYPIIESDSYAFEDLLSCARAFGACIMQRDDPGDALPKLPEPPTYELERVEECRAEVDKFASMTIEDARRARDAEAVDVEKKNAEYVEDNRGAKDGT